MNQLNHFCQSQKQGPESLRFLLLVGRTMQSTTMVSNAFLDLPNDILVIISTQSSPLELWALLFTCRQLRWLLLNPTPGPSTSNKSRVLELFKNDNFSNAVVTSGSLAMLSYGRISRFPCPWSWQTFQLACQATQPDLMRFCWDNYCPVAHDKTLHVIGCAESFQFLLEQGFLQRRLYSGRPSSFEALPPLIFPYFTRIISRQIYLP